MGSDSELIRLEKYIERLLTGYASLKAEKQQVEQHLEKNLSDNTRNQKDLAQIEQQLKEQKAENAKMRKELDSLNSERVVMRDRVNNLISQIEQWESEIDGQGGGGESGDEESEDEDPEAATAPETKITGDDGRGSVQKKLFSA